MLSNSRLNNSAWAWNHQLWTRPAIHHTFVVTSKWQHEMAIKPPAASPEPCQALCSTPNSDFWCWLERRYKGPEDKLHKADTGKPTFMLCPTMESYHRQSHHMPCDVWVKSFYIHHFSVFNSSFVCDSTYNLCFVSQSCLDTIYHI